MIDSGAQLNLVSHTLLPFLQFEPIIAAAARVRGISGVAKPTQRWISYPLTLENGITIQIRAAVFTDLPCLVLLGMPFLLEVQATHDVPASMLQTRHGPLPLYSASPPCNSHLAVSNEPPEPEIDLEASNLTGEEKRQVLDLLREYHDLWRGGHHGKALEFSHQIKLAHNRPVVLKPRVMTEAQQKVIKEELDKMLENGIIRPSQSPYASEVVLVRKKTGDWRFCVDYRQLNRVTVPDKYPLPRISDLIQAVKGSMYFAALDLRGGYWQVPMEVSSIMYTAFRCFLGLFEFLVMPFGLVNAPATFQRMVDQIFGDLRFSGVLCYLDDILVHSPTFRQTLTLLRTVFGRLRNAKLTLNLPKSSFFPKKLKYLGQIIMDGRLHPDPKKLEALEKIKPPATLHEVRSLLGFLGYYQNYIPRYAIHLAPTFELLRNHCNQKRYNATTAIEWTPSCQDGVQKAIAELRKAVLTVPLDGDEFQIETDASATAVGAILSVKRGDELLPVEYRSTTLSKTQRNWPTREREAFAIVDALKKFDHYVRGRPTTVITDHESLKWMLECPKGKIARWASLLAEYPITVYHKRGSQMVHVDFLSRFLDDEPDPVADRMCYHVTEVPIPSLEEILKAQKQLPPPSGKGFQQHEGHIYYHGLLYVPQTYRHRVIAACHSTLPFNHPGVKKTKRAITKMFNWPNLHQDVVRHLQSCLQCRRARSGRERLQGLQRVHPVPGVFDTVYVDFWECTYRGEEHHLLMTMIDQTTKWAECVPIPNKSAAVVASTLLRYWIYRFGVPKTLLSDQDKSFNSALLCSMYAKLGTTKLTSTPYHPEGNAVIESFHRTLSTGLRFLDHRRLPFEEAIDLILYAYRSTLHSTTNQSPGYLTYGVDLRLPHDNDWRAEPVVEMAERLKFLSALRLDVQLRAQQLTVVHQKKKTDDRILKEFEVGQLVLCRAQAIDRLRYRTAYYKAVPRWSTPYRVVRVNAHKTVAVLRCLLTGSARQVHIQDVQFVLPPVDDQQQAEWKAVIEGEALSFYNPEQAQTMIDKFFDRLQQPQANPEPDCAEQTQVTKRQREQ